MSGLPSTSPAALRFEQRPTQVWSVPALLRAIASIGSAVLVSVAASAVYFGVHEHEATEGRVWVLVAVAVMLLLGLATLLWRAAWRQRLEVSEYGVHVRNTVGDHWITWREITGVFAGPRGIHFSLVGRPDVVAGILTRNSLNTPFVGETEGDRVAAQLHARAKGRR